MMNRHESETVNFQKYDHMLTIQPLSDILIVEIRPKISSYLQKQNVNNFSVSLKDQQKKCKSIMSGNTLGHAKIAIRSNT